MDVGSSVHWLTVLATLLYPSTCSVGRVSCAFGLRWPPVGSFIEVLAVRFVNARDDFGHVVEHRGTPRSRAGQLRRVQIRRQDAIRGDVSCTFHLMRVHIPPGYSALLNVVFH